MITAHSGYVKNMVFVRLGILISWKGTRERGNPCKNTVKKIPQLTCVLINPGVLVMAENLRNIGKPVSSVPRLCK